MLRDLEQPRWEITSGKNDEFKSVSLNSKSSEMIKSHTICYSRDINDAG